MLQSSKTLTRSWLPLVLMGCLVLPAATSCKKKKKSPKKATDEYQLPPSECARVPFRMTLREANKKVATNSYVQVILLANNAQADVDHLFVSAKISSTPSQGLLQGKLRGEKGYKQPLQDTCLRMLALEKHATEEAFRQGKPLKFKIKYMPKKGADPGTEIAITVTIVQKEEQGTTVHQEEQTQTIRIKAPGAKKPRKGKDRA